MRVVLEPVVFVDIDCTLVHTTGMSPLQWRVPPTRTLVKYGWHRMATKARPGADQFLTELANHYRVSVLTMGLSKFQDRVLQALKLRDLVEQIYGPDNVYKLKPPQSFVLIDDMPGASQIAACKMKWLGRDFFGTPGSSWRDIVAAHYVQCEPFCGDDNVQRLSDLLPAVHTKISLQKVGEPL